MNDSPGGKAGAGPRGHRLAGHDPRASGGLGRAWHSANDHRDVARFRDRVRHGRPVTATAPETTRFLPRPGEEACVPAAVPDVAGARIGDATGVIRVTGVRPREMRCAAPVLDRAGAGPQLRRRFVTADAPWYGVAGRRR